MRWGGGGGGGGHKGERGEKGGQTHTPHRFYCLLARRPQNAK